MESKPVKLGSELVHLYTRKNQIDHLLKSVLSHIWESQKTITLPSDFIFSLKESIGQLPAETVVDVWTILNKELQDHYLNYNECSSEKFELVGKLLSLFLENVSVDQVPERTATALNGQLKETVDFTMSHLKSRCIDQTNTDDGISVICLLLLACTRYMLSLPEDSAVFRAIHWPALSDVESAVEISDLSPFFLQLTAQQWKKIHWLIAGKRDYKLNIIWEHLLLCGLKMCHMVDFSNKQFIRKERLCDYLILEKLQNLDLWKDSDWNDELCSVTEENYAVAFWSLLCDNLSFLLPGSSIGARGPYHHTFAKALLSVLLLVPDVTNKTSQLRQSSLKFLNQFCHSNGVFRLQSMHSDLFSVWICHLLKLFGVNEEKRSKRMRSHPVKESLRHFFSLLEYAPSDGKLVSDKGEVLWPSQELLTSFNELLLQQSENEEDASCLDERKTEEIVKLLEIMRDFLLRCLNLVDGIRCFLASFALLAVRSKSISLFETVLKVIDGLLDQDLGVQLVLQGINANRLLSFIWSLSDFAEQQMNQADLMKETVRLFKMVVRNVFRQPQSVQGFNQFVNENVSKLMKMKKRDNPLESMTKPMLCLVTCLESTHKVLCHAYVRPDVKSLLTESNATLVEHFWKLLNKFCPMAEVSSLNLKSCSLLENSDFSADTSFGVFLLSGYVCQLEAVQQGVEDDEINQELEKILEVLPILCQMCLNYLRVSEKRDVLSRCLEFIGALSTHYKITSKFLPGDALSHVWTVLLDVLRRDVGHRLLPLDGKGTVQNTSDAKLSATIRKTVAMVTRNFELNEFDRHLQLLHSDLKSCSLGGNVSTAVAAFQVMQELTTQSLNDECQNAFYRSCQKLLILVQEIPSGCRNILVTGAILDTETKLISLGPSFLESNELSLCLSAFAEIDLQTTDDLDDFVNLFEKSYYVLNALFLHQVNFIHNAVPACLVVIKKLLRAIMIRSRQDAHKRLDHTYLNKLDNCARLIYRLTGLVCENKIDFAKVAPFFVYEYVSEVQRGTLYPLIKTTLLMAIYKWLDICNDYGIAQLHRVLPPGAKEIFRFIHEEFERNYRYKGRS